MAGLINPKRQRAEEPEEPEEVEDLKRQKSYNQIESLLEEEEEEPMEGLSSIITTLQQEISSPKETTTLKEEDEEQEERERVMRHLLEASDDELGIPNGEFLVGAAGVEDLAVCDAFWELEDEAANYYALVHSQLFM